MRPLVALVLGLALSVAPGCADARPDRATHAAPPHRQQTTAPTFHVSTVATGLDIPWDVRTLSLGHYLVTQRDRATLTLVRADGSKRDLRFPSGKVWVSGETGLMGLEIDPAVGTNGRIYTCSGWRTADGGHDVRVIAWRLDADRTAVSLARTLVSGMPSTTGRHGGCQLLITRDGSLLIGTGDAATTANPQDLDTLGGKTLRINRFTGAPWRTNPWRTATTKRRYVDTYGHRNVQGLAQRADGSLWSVEQGTYRDDEVNRLGPGHNYGWQPGPGYDESPPMTDFSLPGRQYAARWSSGDPTLATSGGTFVPSSGWGRWSGTLALGALKATQVRFVKLDASGHLLWSAAPAALRRFGRLRCVYVDRDGSLLVTTANGGSGLGGDRLLRVRFR
jgi:glucose/arabinose dehydrogenase